MGASSAQEGGFHEELLAVKVYFKLEVRSVNVRRTDTYQALLSRAM